MRRAYVVPGNPLLVCLMGGSEGFAEGAAMVYLSCRSPEAAQALVASLTDNVSRVEVVA